jgi:membrane protein YdbS with pleckstrin-like domain
MESLHRRVQLLWFGAVVFGASLLAAALLLVDAFLVPLPTFGVVAAWIAIVVPGGVHTLLRYRRWGFRLDDDSLFLVRGVLTRVDTSVPYVRVQHVDTQRGPLERAVGLGSVVVYTAGSRGADIEVPGLRPERATALRERLRDLAVESEATDAV